MFGHKITSLDDTTVEQSPANTIEIESKVANNESAKALEKNLPKHILSQQVIGFGYQWDPEEPKIIAALCDNLIASFITYSTLVLDYSYSYDDRHIEKYKLVISNTDTGKIMKQIHFEENDFLDFAYSFQYGLATVVSPNKLTIWDIETFAEKFIYEPDLGVMGRIEIIPSALHNLVILEKDNNKYHLRQWADDFKLAPTTIFLDYINDQAVSDNSSSVISKSVISKFIFKNKLMLISDDGFLNIHELPLNKEHTPIRIRDFPLAKLKDYISLVTNDELSLIIYFSNSELSIWSINDDFVATKLETFSNVSAVADKCFPDGSIAFVASGIIQAYNPDEKSCLQIDTLKDPQTEIVTLTVMQDSRLGVLQKYKDTPTQAARHQLHLYSLAYLQKKWSGFLTSMIQEGNVAPCDHEYKINAGIGDVVASYCHAPVGFFKAKNEAMASIELVEEKQEQYSMSSTIPRH